MEKFRCNETVKLFYQDHIKYPCLSENWGKSKGQDHFNDVCVMLNATVMKHYKKSDFSSLAISSRNKLYEAFTRANNNIFLIEESQVKHLKLERFLLYNQAYLLIQLIIILNWPLNI